ncbi:YdeI/OmpD-associated family protein [Pengzhenrongella sicca]|uniref:YdeI/OmpD-associated family protein n=1 Tax=Pengzhenrongella sicca TaxID=2819238 RepID=A0A8A4ZHD2_9MICO|nr:YdeI/OmpD-associated family protein [Pengzhenrongella sicca]QTE30801.1 YdeI/OmpD-associated family protein [Pengzhenrongella sicca]
MTDDRVRVEVESAQAWRDWLAANHATSPGAWLVTWKKHTGRPAPGYDEAVTEALAFGWVDSLGARLDDDRTMLWFSPRRPGSAWSRPNKVRVARLEEEGRMAAAGRRAVEVAKANGAWVLLDEVEDLVVPADLAAAFAARPGAAEHWDAFPRSARRGILEWIMQAKRPPTRERRIEETAAAAARGERAHQQKPRPTA